MTNLVDLLREADPLNEDSGRLDQARDQIRRRVIAATETAPRRSGIRRRAVLGTAGVLTVTVVVAGLLNGLGGRGTVRAAVRFEMRLAETQPVPGLIVARVANSDRTLYLHPEAIATNDDIVQSWVTPDGPEHFSISVQFLEPGAQRVRQATANHIGRPVAILIDGEVVMAPTLRSAIGNSAMITGDFSQEEAQRIANGIH